MAAATSVISIRILDGMRQLSQDVIDATCCCYHVYVSDNAYMYNLMKQQHVQAGVKSISLDIIASKSWLEFDFLEHPLHVILPWLPPPFVSYHRVRLPFVLDR
jgi:hypothetical protein